jgi:hypothetical protein
MLSNLFYELFLPEALQDKLISLGNKSWAISGQMICSAVM